MSGGRCGASDTALMTGSQAEEMLTVSRRPCSAARGQPAPRAQRGQCRPLEPSQPGPAQQQGPSPRDLGGSGSIKGTLAATYSASHPHRR